jgi:hypothetical protein
MKQNKTDLLRNFTGALDDLDKVMAMVPESGLDWSEGEGEWCIRQIIHHLAEDCTVYGFILERALATPGCKVFFGEFPGNETWANRLAFDQRPINNALVLIRAQRTYFAEMLRFLPNLWENKAIFFNESGEKLAESSIYEMVSMLTEHMQEHTQTIERIIKLKGLT